MSVAAFPVSFLCLVNHQPSKCKKLSALIIFLLESLKRFLIWDKCFIKLFMKNGDKALHYLG